MHWCSEQAPSGADHNKIHDISSNILSITHSILVVNSQINEILNSLCDTQRKQQ